MIRVWLALDPETRRVTMQDREFGEGDFPLGLRGLGWPIRLAEISEDEWDAILAGDLTGDAVDRIHRAAWTEAGPSEWPNS